MQDDIYRGMLIPKGSIIVANALSVPVASFFNETLTCCTPPPPCRSMAWDDNVYADPTKFYPERFLSKSDGGNEEPYPIGSFGFGRRYVINVENGTPPMFTHQ
jgi:hypothetical protein